MILGYWDIMCLAWKLCSEVQLTQGGESELVLGERLSHRGGKIAVVQVVGVGGSSCAGWGDDRQLLR